MANALPGSLVMIMRVAMRRRHTAAASTRIVHGIRTMGAEEARGSNEEEELSTPRAASAAASAAGPKESNCCATDRPLRRLVCPGAVSRAGRVCHRPRNRADAASIMSTQRQGVGVNMPMSVVSPPPLHHSDAKLHHRRSYGPSSPSSPSGPSSPQLGESATWPLPTIGATDLDRPLSTNPIHLSGSASVVPAPSACFRRPSYPCSPPILRRPMGELSGVSLAGQVRHPGMSVPAPEGVIKQAQGIRPATIVVPLTQDSPFPIVLTGE
ncbi:hypothetical protein M433DRAFT_186044 [Acidomyces richmondensis BFW]|nr:hypothetical protein M433DRAFT_186044 [Acidomyces richmondensis BFW]